MPISRIVSQIGDDLEPEEVKLESSLRPQGFSEVIGRVREKQTLQMMIKAALHEARPLDHVLFHGPPGLGKTSLAQVTAKEMGVSFQVTSGPAIEKQGDLAAILTSLPAQGILFIDEVHRLHRNIEEVLYPAMEDGVLDIVVGKGAGAKTVRLDLEPFTIIAATTRIGLLSKPLLDRFGVDFRLDYYDLPEMTELVRQKAKALQLKIAEDAAGEIAARARRTPRIAVKILKRVRDHAVANGVGRAVDLPLVQATLDLLEIDNAGLDYLDKKIMLTIINNFRGGPVGLNSLAAAISEEVDTISDVYEPYLIQEGFLERTARGRKATHKALTHFDINLNLLN